MRAKPSESKSANHGRPAPTGQRHRSPTTQEDILLELEGKKAILAAAERLAKLRGWSYHVASHSLQWSSDANSIFAFSPEELRNLSLSRFFERIHPEDRTGLETLVHDVLQGKRRTFTFRYRFLAPSGKHKAILGDGEALTGADGKVQRVVGTLMDASAYKRSRKRLPDDNGASVLQESSSVWLWEQDQEFRFTNVTRTRDEKLNARHASAIGKRRWEGPGAVPCTGTWEDHRKLLEQHLPFHDFEYRVRLQSGKERVLSTTGVPAYTARGRFIGYRGTTSDITELKAAQEKALQSQSLLQLASRLGRVGAWTLDLSSMQGAWSGELVKLYEFEPDQPVTVDLLMSLVAADWRKAVGTAMRTCHMQGTSVDIEFPSLTAKGNPVWLRLTAEAVHDRAGSIASMQGAVQDITERMRDAERLRILNHQLTTTLESITDGFVTLDRDLRFTFVNRQAERRSGLARADLLGKGLAEQFPTFLDSGFRAEFERALREGTAGHVEAFSPAIGRWLSVAVFPSEQGLALFIRDVTASKEAQQQLVLSEERHRLLFETSADGIIKVAPDGRIRRCNRAACTMFGRTEAQMQRLSSRQLVQPSDKRLQDMISERLRSGGARGELTLLRADGSTFEAEVNTSTFETAQGDTYVNLVVRDVTERVQLRQKMIALNEELAEQVRQRTRELERANNELKGFARSLAHDLRQPIAAAKSLGFAVEMALDKEHNKKARSYAAQVIETCQWMGEYVEALLSLARISQAVLVVEEVDLSALAAGLLNELRDQHPGRHALVEVQPGLHAKGDRALLRLLLQNLLGNAWKFTARSDPARISFKAAASSDGEVVYSVADDGAGFDASGAERLFETFQRFHRSSDYPGTGIGLANAHKIVLRHGGRIWAESQPGQGATFFFTLATSREELGGGRGTSARGGSMSAP